MRIAVIDLGTNTCNLLIAEIEASTFRILHRSKEHVKLGDDRIKQNELSPAALQRTIDAFNKHFQRINRFKADKIRAFATSAVRTAANKINFLDSLGKETGCLIKIISGETEAELIFNGVLLALGDLTVPSLILDIGGGSNETILAYHRNILWKESRPAGMARVIHNFQISDPIRKDEINQIESFFAEEHQKAINLCKEKGVQSLIGCSGAFDTIADLIDRVEPGTKERNQQRIKLTDFQKIYNQIIQSSREERMRMTGIDLVRIDLIVPAVILINTLIKEAELQEIIQTDFALREGVLFNELHREHSH